MADTESEIAAMVVAGDWESLVKALRGKESKIRKEAAFGLAQLGDTRAVEGLVKALGDDRTDTRRWSAWALGRLGSVRAFEALVGALDDGNWRVRRNVVNALEQLGDPRAVDPLITVLEDQDEGVRMLAASALGDLGDRRAVLALKDATYDKEPEVRTAASEALEELGEGEPEPSEPPDLPHGSQEPLVELRMEDVPDEVEFIEYHAELPQELASEEAALAASLAATDNGSDEWVPHIVDKLNHIEPAVRESAAWTLGRMRAEEAIAPLIAALGDRSENVRHAATQALEVIGQEAVEPLISALNMSNNRTIRLHSIEALDRLGCALAEASKAQPTIEWRRQLCEQIEDELVDSMHDEYQDVRKAAADALHKLREISGSA